MGEFRVRLHGQRRRITLGPAPAAPAGFAVVEEEHAGILSEADVSGVAGAQAVRVARRAPWSEAAAGRAATVGRRSSSRPYSPAWVARASRRHRTRAVSLLLPGAVQRQHGTDESQTAQRNTTTFHAKA